MSRAIKTVLLPLTLVLALGAGLAQQSMPATQPTLPPELQPSSRVVSVNGLAQFLKDLQPKSPRDPGGKLEVVAAYLHPSLVGSFDAMAHGWCEGLVFLGCGISHYPISVTILTGEASRDFFRVPATEKFLALPGGLSRHAAAVYLLKKTPSSAVWLVWGTKPLEAAQAREVLVSGQDEYLITGPLLNGTGDTATIVKAPALATTMHRQMFLSELVSQSPRWRP
jgi:hypothetical protein